jgi:hypothetical protein
MIRAHSSAVRRAAMHQPNRQAAMNLKRGLLRLWVVLALVWVVPMTWLQWDELMSTKLSKLAEFRQQNPQYDNMSDFALADAFYKEYYSNIPRDQFDAKIGLTKDALEADWSRRREAVAFVLLPPLGVLVLGVGLFWAAQGFGSRSV